MRKPVRGLCMILAAAAVLWGLAGCSGANAGSTSAGDGGLSGSAASVGPDGKAVRVGSKGFTENLLCSELYALALEEAGYTVERAFDVASSVAHEAITAGQIDVYPEYTGTGLITILGHEPVTDADEVFAIITEGYAEMGLVWLTPAAANDGQGIVINTSVAEEYGIATLSDLQAHAGKIRFASQGEFELRADGLPALEEIYGAFNFASINVYSNALKYDILESDEADAAPAYTTEGQLSQPQFTLLEDDKHAWPPYNIAPVMTKAFWDENPAAVAAIDAVDATLDTATITALNAEVDVEMREFEEVAAEYYATIEAGVKEAVQDL